MCNKSRGSDRFTHTERVPLFIRTDRLCPRRRAVCLRIFLIISISRSADGSRGNNRDIFGPGENKETYGTRNHALALAPRRARDLTKSTDLQKRPVLITYGSNHCQGEPAYVETAFWWSRGPLRRCGPNSAVGAIFLEVSKA